MKRFQSLFVVAALFLMACTSDPYKAAIKGSSDVSQAVSSAIKITAAYYSAGTFSDAQKATAAKYFTIVTDCNLTFRKSVVDIHNAGKTGVQAFLPIADGFVSCVKNSAPVVSDQKVSNVLKAVDTAMNGISLAISNAKGAQ